MVTLLQRGWCKPQALTRASHLTVSRPSLLTSPHATSTQHSSVATRAIASGAATEQLQASASKDGISVPTFQEAIFRLQQYWSAQGCIVWLPHNTEVRHVRTCAAEVQRNAALL